MKNNREEGLFERIMKAGGMSEEAINSRFHKKQKPTEQPEMHPLRNSLYLVPKEEKPLCPYKIG